MEVCGWQHGQRECKGSLALLPPSWDTLAQAYRELTSLVSKIPYKRRLILYLTFRGTSIKIDLGDVKAAGVVCILGIGFGLGTVLIYKLYCNFIRPVLSSQSETDVEKSDNDDEFYAYVSPSDSAPNNKMGNSGCKTSAAVFYSKEYGVAFGKNYKEASSEEDRPVQLRQRKQPPVPRRSSLQSDKDSAIGFPTEMGLSAHSNVNRDSFYSTCTAESGFVNGPDTYDDSSSCDSYSHLRKGSRSLSLQENYSPTSLLDKRLRYLRGSRVELEESDSESRSTISLHSADHVGLNQCSVFLTPATESVSSAKSSPQRTFFSPKSSPFHQSTGRATVITRVGLSSGHSEGSSCLSVGQSEWDHSLEISESLQSLSGGGSSVGEWSAEDEEEGRDSMSPLPSLTQSTSDFQFRQSVLERMRNWASQNNDAYSTRSPTPERVAAEQTRTMRRSRSLDRQYPEEDLVAEEVMLEAEPLVDLGETTTKNLEAIETGLHGIQDEFEDIATAITRLCTKGNSDSPGRTSATSTPPVRIESQHARELVKRTRTRWERSPSLPGSDRSSRASSVELCWDHGYLQDEDAQHVIKSRLGHTRQMSLPERSGNLEDDGSPSPSASRTQKLQGKHKKKAHSLSNSPAGMSWKSPGADVISDKSVNEEACFTPAVPGGGPPLRQNISEAEDIVEYAEREWKGGTPKAEAIKQGYRRIPEVFKCKRFRIIRGDNYCALRSCLYQALTSDADLDKRLPSFIDVINSVNKLYQDPSSGLQEWNFGDRIPHSPADKLQTMCKCLTALQDLVVAVGKLPTYEEREKAVLESMNSASDDELMEGMKLLMLVSAHQLQTNQQADKDVPIFAILLFARDTSGNLKDFILNHLNKVGDSAGIDQIEVCLLGHTLKSCIKVARLSKSEDEEEFISDFPDSSPEDWPSICVLAEDDRHYNVPIP